MAGESNIYPRLVEYTNLYAGHRCIVCGEGYADATATFERSESDKRTVYYHKVCRGYRAQFLFDACVRRFSEVDALIPHERNLSE